MSITRTDLESNCTAKEEVTFNIFHEYICSNVREYTGKIYNSPESRAHGSGPSSDIY
jgi:hypothetical protein